MAVFESDKFTINTNSAEVIQFVSVLKNLIEILPQDRIEDWQADDKYCSFKIKGLAHISLELEDRTNSQLVLKSRSDKPFDFKLIISVNQSPENQNSIDLSANFDADVNSFMGAMLKSPLTNFLNHLGEQLKRKYAEA